MTREEAQGHFLAMYRRARILAGPVDQEYSRAAPPASRLREEVAFALDPVMRGTPRQAAVRYAQKLARRRGHS